MKKIKLFGVLTLLLFSAPGRSQTSNQPMSAFFSDSVKSFLRRHPPKKVTGFKPEKLQSSNRDLKQTAGKKNKNPTIKPHKSQNTPGQAKQKFFANDKDLANKVKKIKKAG